MKNRGHRHGEARGHAPEARKPSRHRNLLFARAGVR
jgi:hypothetical protein